MHWRPQKASAKSSLPNIRPRFYFCAKIDPAATWAEKHNRAAPLPGRLPPVPAALVGLLHQGLRLQPPRSAPAIRAVIAFKRSRYWTISLSAASRSGLGDRRSAHSINSRSCSANSRNSGSDVILRSPVILATRSRAPRPATHQHRLMSLRAQRSRIASSNPRLASPVLGSIIFFAFSRVAQ